MSAPMMRWVSTLFSGVNMCLDPSICDWKRQPSGAEYLESTAVGEDGAVPVFEFVQSACCPERVKAGTEIKVIGVAEYDFGVDIFLEVPVVYALDRSDGAHRHEYGGADLAVVGGYDAGPC